MGDIMADKEELTSDIIEDFAETVIGGDPVEKKDIIYGEVVEKNGTFYGKVDGSVTLSPMNYSVEVEDGDRVMFQMKNRTLTAVGNITAPASARTATNFIKLTDDGFMVGELDDNGSPTGSYTLMKHDSFHIVDKTGQILASFDRSAVSFGNKASFGENGVTLRNGAGNILATFTETGTTIRNKNGQELAKFDQNGVAFKNSNGYTLAYFGNNGVTLYDSWGHELAALTQSGVTFKNSSGYTVAGFGGSGVTLYNNIGQALASFSGDGASIYGAGNKRFATFNSSGFNVYSGNVAVASLTNEGIVFRDDEGRTIASLKRNAISFYDSYSGIELVNISTSGIYLRNTFGSMASFTPSGVTIGNTSFTSSGVNIGNGRAVFNDSGVSLNKGQVVLDINGTHLKNASGTVTVADFSVNGIYLRDGSGDSILEVDKNGMRLRRGSIKSSNPFSLSYGNTVINLEGDRFNIYNDNAGWNVFAGPQTAGFRVGTTSVSIDNSGKTVTIFGKSGIYLEGPVYVNGVKVH